MASEPALIDTPAQDAPLDFRAIWRVVSRRRGLILITFSIVMSISVVYTLRLPKIYSATTSLIIEMAAPKVLGSGQVQDVTDTNQPFWANHEYYETQYNVIRSRSVADRVVQKMRVGRDDRLLGLDNVDSEDAREKGLKALQVFRKALADAKDPAALVLGRIQVDPVKESRVLRLSVEDADPVLASALTNAFASAFMDQNMASKAVTTSAATGSLELRLPVLNEKVDEAVQQLTDFKKKQKIGASFEERQRLNSNRMSRVSEELLTVRIRKANLKARSDAILALKKAETRDDVTRAALIPDALAATELALKMRVFEARLDCDLLEQRLLPEHPKLIDCKLKLANLERVHNAEIDTVFSRALAEFTNAVQNEKNLLDELADTKAEAEEMSSYEPEYQKLKRAHETNLRLYDVALKSLRESDLSETTRLNNVNVLDVSRPILAPSKPNVRQNLLLGFLLALSLGLGFALGLEFLDNTISTQEQIEERLGVAFLGIIPSLAKKGDRNEVASDLVVFEQPKSAAAECCRAIRTNLLFMSPERPLKSILVTSSGPRDGKTTAAASLAITMAESGIRVLLVDADLRRPRVHKAFKIANGAGLSSLILGEGTLAGTVKSSNVPNLSLLTSGPVPPNPAELLHTEVFKRLLAQMGQDFDRVIIDSPPVAAVADAVVISTQVDGTVVVVKNLVTSREMARRSIRALRDVNARIFGAILNDIDLEDRQAGGYYYYSKYGYYYGESETKDGSAV